MFEQDIRYLKFKTHLSCYCPICKKTFHEEKQHEKSLIFNGSYKKQDVLLKLSPYLDVFDIKTSIPIGPLL